MFEGYVILHAGRSRRLAAAALAAVLCLAPLGAAELVCGLGAGAEAAWTAEGPLETLSCGGRLDFVLGLDFASGFGVFAGAALSAEKGVLALSPFTERGRLTGTAAGLGARWRRGRFGIAAAGSVEAREIGETAVACLRATVAPSALVAMRGGALRYDLAFPVSVGFLGGTLDVRLGVRVSMEAGWWGTGGDF